MSEENNNSTERHGQPAELLYMGSTPIPGSNISRSHYYGFQVEVNNI